MVGFAGNLCPEVKAVRGEIRKVGGCSVSQTFSSANHNHKHKDAPEYAQRGKKAAQAIFSQGGKDFLPVV
jgi:hypothetical protein